MHTRHKVGRRNRRDYRLRHRPELGRQRHGDRDHADRGLPPYPSESRRHRRVPRRGPSLGRRTRPRRRGQRRLPARRQHPDRLGARRGPRFQHVGQVAAGDPPHCARRGPDRRRGRPARKANTELVPWALGFAAVSFIGLFAIQYMLRREVDRTRTSRSGCGARPWSPRTATKSSDIRRWRRNSPPARRRGASPPLLPSRSKPRRALARPANRAAPAAPRRPRASRNTPPPCSRKS